MSQSRLALLAGCVLLAVALRPGDPAPRKAWVVQELSWRFLSNGDPFRLDDGEPGHAVRLFASRGGAEAAARALELDARRGKNPFHHQAAGGHGRLGPFTSDERALLAVLRREGLAPPAYSDDLPRFVDEEPWAAWWDVEAPKWDEARRTRVWDALDRVRFFRVVEVRLEP